jgi:hypothetical protein
LCEGVRRQKGDIALTLLLTYKDDEASLLKIIDKILDRDIYVLFKQTSTLVFNPFSPNFKRIQSQQLNEFNQLDLELNQFGAKSPAVVLNSNLNPSLNNVAEMPVVSPPPPPPPPPQIPASLTLTPKPTHLQQQKQQHPTPTLHSLSVASKYQSNKINSAIDSLSSGWEESENESPNLSGDVSLLETKYRCLTLRQQQHHHQSHSNSQQLSNQPLTAAATANLPPESASSDTSPTTSRRTLSSINNLTATNPAADPIAIISQQNKKNSKIDDSGDDSGESSSSAENVLTKPSTVVMASENHPIINLVDNTVTVQSETATPTAAATLLLHFQQQQQQQPQKQTANLNNTKFNYNDLINQMNMTNLNSFSKQSNQQPSEALAHFMFEFSKSVLSKAGGSACTSVFLNHQNHQQGGGPHRNLHICSFLISLYALGLHNCVQPSWLSRTYSSHVTWVNSQAVDIGFPAICILIECWQGLLTPSECVSLADRVSRGRDNMAVKAAAELAFSALRYAHLMNLTEIQRALIQCKEQSSEMLQRANVIVEHAVKDASGSNLLEILFTVAKKWGNYLSNISR